MDSPLLSTGSLAAGHPHGDGSTATRSAAARIRIIGDHGQFAELREAWNALVERSDDQLFYRHEFVQLWLQHFAADATLRILTLFDGSGRLIAALPVIAVRSRLFGIPVRELQAAANLHSCRFDLIADDPATAAAAFVAHLRQRRDWDLLRLIDSPADGQASALLAAASQSGLPAGQWVSQHSPYCTLPSTWAAFEATLHKRFRSSLRRRRRRLSELGELGVERYTGGPELAERLAEGLALEAGGWKGRAGTAITQDDATLAFYRELVAQQAERGHLALWFLRLDGKAIAFDLTLEYRGRLLLLKTAYDERHAACSPGQLLLEDELRDAIERGLHEVDFLGPSSPAKRDWTRLSRPHGWTYLFRGLRGRLLWLIKFCCLPAVKRVLGR